jgi:hypothetical protein
MSLSTILGYVISAVLVALALEVAVILWYNHRHPQIDYRALRRGKVVDA